MLMDPSHPGAGAYRDRFASRRHEPVWLYDPIAEEFVRDPASILYRGWGYGPARRWGIVAYGLFAQGWMCPLFFCGILVVAFVAWLSGIH
jgi:hypothetical protein